MQAGSYGKKYESTLGAFMTIIREEGIGGLYKGAIPTSQRAAIIACTELSIYDESKHWIIKKKVNKRRLSYSFHSFFNMWLSGYFISFSY